jgi:hypothetical protein
MRGPLALAIVWQVACSGGTALASPSPVTAQGADSSAVLVPAGHGTLRQEEVTLSIRSGPLQVKVTPLAESVIRLLAPDTYQRLHALATGRATDAAGRRELFLVSFFSNDPDVSFTPEDVQIVHRGAILRPAHIQPLTSGFGRQRLQQQETQSALYTFEESFNYDLPLVVRYGLDEAAGDWLQIQQRLERERARVRALTRG